MLIRLLITVMIPGRFAHVKFAKSKKEYSVCLLLSDKRFRNGQNVSMFGVYIFVKLFVVFFVIFHCVKISNACTFKKYNNDIENTTNYSGRLVN